MKEIIIRRRMKKKRNDELSGVEEAWIHLQLAWMLLVDCIIQLFKKRR